MKKYLSYLSRLNFFLIVFSLLIFNDAVAQAPKKMSYQAVIRNANNDLIISNNISIKISILQDSETGNAVYVETQNTTTNSVGLISIKIGEGVVEKGSFDIIDWGKSPYFIKTETDINGGTNYILSGISELMSVPYALYAANSGTPGFLKTSDGLEVNNTLKNISDNLNNNTPLKISLTSITNSGPGNINSNTMFGENSGNSNTTGFENNFYGNSSGYSNTTGWRNIFIGRNSGYSNTTGFHNILIGNAVGFSTTTGTSNLFLGDSAGYFNTTGTSNLFLGENSGYSNITGGQNIFLGRNSGYSNTTGDGNTCLGLQAGQYGTTGYHNVFLGYSAGNNNITGAKIVAIGALSNPLSNNDNNEIIIGSYVKGNGSNTVTIGDSFIKNTYLNGTVSAPQFKVSSINTAPSSSSDTGTTGEIRYTSTGIYWCIATNNWIKVTGTTF